MAELLSVDEHNEHRREARRAAKEAVRKTGVACPVCGAELGWAYESGLAIGTRCVRKARCGPCGLTVELEA